MNCENSLRNWHHDPLYVSPEIQLERVRLFAIHAHGEQKYGDEPYVVHLDEVVAVLRSFGYNDLRNPYHLIILKAAYLHDVIEDSKLADRRELYGMVFRVAGAEAADAVRRVTDAELPNPNATRKEIKAATYPHIWAHPAATIVKLADRIANVRRARQDFSARPWQRYSEEYTTFRSALYFPGIADEMWAHLDELMLPPN